MLGRVQIWALLGVTHLFVVSVLIASGGDICVAQSAQGEPAYVSVDQLGAHSPDSPRPTTALQVVEEMHRSGNWFATGWQCEQFMPVFGDFHSYGDGLTSTQYKARKTGFLARCGEAAYRSFEGSGRLSDLEDTIEFLAGVGDHPNCWRAVFLLGVARVNAAQAGASDEHGSWSLEVQGFWTMWKAAKLLSARGEREFLKDVRDKDVGGSEDSLCGEGISLAVLAGDKDISIPGTKFPAGAEVPVTVLLMRRLMHAVQRHTDNPDKIIELLPLMRLVSDRLRYFHESGARRERTATGEIRTRERGEGRGGSAGDSEVIDSRFDYKPLTVAALGGRGAPPPGSVGPDVVNLASHYADLAEEASGLLFATFYNDENPAVGVHRLLGLRFATMYRDEMTKPDSGEGHRNLAMAERYHDLARSCLKTAIKNVGRGLSRDGIEANTNDLVDSDSDMPSGLDSDSDADRLARAELHLLLAEIEFDYGQARIGKSFDALRPERRLPMLEAAFTNARAAAKYAEDLGMNLDKPGPEDVDDEGQKPDGECFNLPPSDTFKLRVRREYGVILNRLLVVLDTAQQEELPGITQAQRSNRIAELLVDVQDIPFYYLNKEDHLLLIAFHLLARSGGQRDSEEGLNVAKGSFDLLVDTSLSPLLVWALPNRHPSLDGEVWGDEEGGPCEVRQVRLAPGGIESESSQYSDRCELVAEYLALLKKTGEYDQLRQAIHFMKEPEFAREGERYSVFNLDTCKEALADYADTPAGGNP